MFYYINQLCTPSFPIGLVKTKSDFIVRPVEDNGGGDPRNQRSETLTGNSSPET